MASTYILVMGTLIGVMTWIFLAFRVPGIPFGRTLGTFGGAVLVLVFQVLSPTEAFDAINLETIALLFGTMIISVLLEREGFFSLFIHFLTYRCTSAYSLLVRLCIASGVLAALMINDTVCVFLTPVVVDLCELHQLPHGPFLIALATSANIGSTATPVGNPQNMIIASLSGISYGDFIIYIGPAAVVCLAINTALLCLWYRKELSGKEVKVCTGRFVRATEEEMEAKMGKHWEKQVAEQKEVEQRRMQRRLKETQEQRPAAPPLDGEDKEMDDLSGVKRRKGGDGRRVDEEVKDVDPVHRVDIQADYALPPAGGAQQAAHMAAHGQKDEAAKEQRDEEKGREVEEKVQQEERVDQPAALSARSMDSAIKPRSSSPTPPPLLHGESVALILYQLQREQRDGLQQADSTKPGSASVAGGDPDEDNELMKRRRTKTRVADRQHPRKTGRQLVQLPPELSTAARVELERKQWRRRTLAAKQAQSGEILAPVPLPDPQPNADPASEAGSALLEPHRTPSSPFSFLQPYLPAAMYTRLLLIPLPSKLLLFSLCLVGTVGAFAGGLNLGWSALGGACAMLVIDWRDPDYVISLVDWSLLVFFTSLFIVTQGFQATGLPMDVWTALQGTIDVTTVQGITVYTIIVLIGSNTVSNVPLVLLLGPSIPSLSNPFQSWLLLSFVSTVAGNLTLVGSVANLIVASRAKGNYLLGFWEYTRFGFPSTIVITVIGVLVVKGMSSLA